MKNNGKHTISFYADGKTATVLNGLAEKYKLPKSQIINLALRSFEQYLREGFLDIRKGRTEVIYHNGYNGDKKDE